VNKTTDLVKTITEVIGMNKNKKLAAAFTLIFTAAATMAGAYALGNFGTNDSSGYVNLSEVDENKTAQTVDENEKLAKAETEETGSEFGMDNVMDATDEYKEESSKSTREGVEEGGETPEAKESTEQSQTTEENTTEEEAKPQEETKAAEETAEVMSTSAVNESSKAELNFTAEQKLSWPVEGNVIMNYNMDSTVYFATLDQYKYNPALIIGCETGNSVKAAADGKIVSIENLDETGNTITVDLGNGYQAVYGQLKDITVKEGDSCKAGEVLGSISDPSCYYMKEGSNLYFQLTKDGTSINPMDYLN
jgi:septal ring factor EnvC (AmiA/AmiB activator)